ncbi:MAG: TauD/TfdA family dioxygenase [Alphaproteobacteria bacterium]
MRTPFEGPHVWTGQDLEADESWRRAWSAAELAEIDAALAHAKAAGADWLAADRAAFPLDRVADMLAEVADELEDGRGFVLIQGLPVERYAPDELRLVWMGLGHWLGMPVPQDNTGQMMRDIQAEPGDLGSRHERMQDKDGGEFLSSKARTYSNGRLRYHTDRTDVVGLLMVRQSASGGESRVASTGAVHNAILARRPDLLELLYQPIHRSRLGEEAGGGDEVYPLPVFGVRDGKLTSHYSRTYVEAAQLMPGTPRMTDAQWAALDLLADVADELAFGMTLRPGDIQLINSHVTYHARAAFEDDAASGRARLLHRLWLAMPNSRALPADHAVLWRNVEAGARRGGIAVG